MGVNRFGCVTLDGEVLVAPYGSKLTDGGRAVDLVGIGAYRIGERVDGGGGAVDAGWGIPETWLSCDRPGAQFTMLQTGPND